MTTAAVISAVLTLLAGIGIFLIACQMMSQNLESASSKKLKSLFSKASHSKLLGVGIGTLGTAAIQSSGATTVMVIGFVNAGIMSLTQAATIIYGANIGTTVTAQIVALGMFGSSGVSTTVIFSAMVGVGAFLALFGKSNKLKLAGGILSGFGMLFVGLEMMSNSMKDFSELENVRLFLASISNPLLLVLLGALLTAIIQSSSVMTSIAIAMVFTELISLDQGIMLTMGSNIGSCVVAIIAGITSGKNAKRTALIHLLFNCSGVFIFLVAGLLIKIATGGTTLGNIFADMFPGAPQTQLAMFHTFFNISTVIIVLPLTNLLVQLVCKLIPSSNHEFSEETEHVFYIDENMLTTPAVAVQQTKNEIVNMASIALTNFNLCLDVITRLNFDNLKTFQFNEKELDFLNGAITDYVVKLSPKPHLSSEDHVYLSTTFRTVRDIERIGDHAENIIEYAVSLGETHQGFTPAAIDEILEVKKLVNELYANVMSAYIFNDRDALAKAAAIEDSIDDFTHLMEDNHIARLSAQVCTPDVGAHYLSLSSNVERIADHFMNVAKVITHL